MNSLFRFVCRRFISTQTNQINNKTLHQLNHAHLQINILECRVKDMEKKVHRNGVTMWCSILIMTLAMTGLALKK